MKYIQLLILLLSVTCSGKKSSRSEASAGKSEKQVLNVYSHRHYDADKIVFNKFTEATGIAINLVKAGADELISRLEIEKDRSPADVLVTVDAMKLNRAKELGLLQSVEIGINNDPIFIEDENYWYGITYRARVIVYDKEDVDVSQLSTYEDLSNEKWRGKVLVRSSSSSYNQSLLASILHANGVDRAQRWAQGIVENMVRDPKGGDRDQIKAIASGVGELALVNTYYVGLLLNSENPEEVVAGKKVGVFFPNQNGRGAHINISGIGIAKYAPNKENAIKFVKFLTGEEAQRIYASHSFEYPVNKNVPADSTVAEWGTFKIDDLAYAKDIDLNSQVVGIFEEVGWN